MHKDNSSGLWKHGLLLTLLFGFTVMLRRRSIHLQDSCADPCRPWPAPMAAFCSLPLIFSSGQELFRKRNLMNYGSVLGHGAYLGPDYTAEALHWMTDSIRAQRSNGKFESLSVARRRRSMPRFTRNCSQTATTRRQGPWSLHPRRPLRGEVSRIDTQACSRTGERDGVLRPKSLLPAREGGSETGLSREAARQMAAFVTWTAWLSVAKRPEANHSYTNNWPYDAAAGNKATAGAMLWSGGSVALLLLALATILYLQHRYRLTAEDVEYPNLRFDVARNVLTPSQRATAKYFVIAMALFLVQTIARRQDGA